MNIMGTSAILRAQQVCTGALAHIVNNYGTSISRTIDFAMGIQPDRDLGGALATTAPSPFVRAAATAGNMARHTIRGITHWNQEMPFTMRGYPHKGLDFIRYRLKCVAVGTVMSAPQFAVNWDIHGMENLVGALEMAKKEGKGVICVSNHRALLEDPLIYFAMFNMLHVTHPKKCWKSTADKMNFNPQGNSLRARAIRWLMEPGNMIFLERAKSTTPTVDADPWSLLKDRLDDNIKTRLAFKARRPGMSMEASLRTYFQGHLTHGASGDIMEHAGLNQIGLLEAIAHADGGGWVHLFPEGTRSRTEQLREPKPGVGKAIYHANDAVVLPWIHHGMHKVSPIGPTELIPRPFNTVVVNVGKPIPAHKFEMLRDSPPSMETFMGISRIAMNAIKALRPFALRRYYGAERAAEMLRKEQAFDVEERPARTAQTSATLFLQELAQQIEAYGALAR